MSLIDKNQISAAFNRAALNYDHIAHFQQETCDMLAHFMSTSFLSIGTPRTVLDGGCGTGYGATLIQKKWPLARIVGCDLSVKMLNQAQKKKIRTVCADLEALPFPDQSFELVWSNLALQWCQTPAVYFELSRVLTKYGGLFFTTLAPGTLAELDLAFSGVDEYRHIRSFFTMDETAKALFDAGFQFIDLYEESHTLYFPDLRTLITSVRGVGANQVGSQRRSSLMGKNAWNLVQKRYEELRTEKGLPLTYRLIFCAAIKP